MPNYYVHNLSPFVVQFAPGVGIRWYGLAYLIAFLIGYWMLRYFARRQIGPLKEPQVLDFMTWAALFGVMLGGRLGYMLFYNLHGFLSDPLSFFLLWKGGMASHGGILGLMIFTLVYAKRHRISWRGIGDNLVVAAPLGLFVGRLANFINGELYGRSTDMPWAVKFPNELLDSPMTAHAAVEKCQAIDPLYGSVEQVVEAVPYDERIRTAISDLLAPRHPSQLYEAFAEGLILFAILWFFRVHRKTPRGTVTGIFFIAYALLRIVCEYFREPDAKLTWIFTRGQFLSLFMILIGLVFLVTAGKPPEPAKPAPRSTKKISPA